ncbi:MAG TPA: hypothetical protein EYH32_00355 [Anaerolineae bacterium]|nr:hypothetical protein [Anaerolineae bacterium]
MSKSVADQQSEGPLPEDLELPLFDPQSPDPLRLVVILDPQQPLCPLPDPVEPRVDTDCACE